MSASIIKASIACLLASFTFFNTFGQPRNFVGFYIEPASSYRTLNVAANHLHMEEHKQRAVWNAGFSYERTITSQLSLYSGVGLSEMNYATRGKSGASQSRSAGVRQKVKTQQIHFIRRFLKIPVGINYLLLKRNGFHVGIGLGVSNNILLGASMRSAKTAFTSDPFIVTVVQYGFSASDHADGYGYRTYNLGGEGTLLFQYLFNRWRIDLLPHFEYLFLPTGNAESKPVEHLYSWGLRLGASFAF